MTDIGGVKLSHVLVTDRDRANRGDFARDDAIKRLKDEYEKALKKHPIGKGARFHFVLVVERQESKS